LLSYLFLDSGVVDAADHHHEPVPVRRAVRSVTRHSQSREAVLPTEEEADREVERLNAVTAGKNCVYWSTITRFYRAGRALDAD
jgi:hypothetical protein